LSLSEAFLRRYRGRTGDAFPDLERTLAELCERGRVAWPALAVDPSSFAACLGESVSRARSLRRELEEVRVEELYLAHACAVGIPEAREAIALRYLSRVAIYIGHMRLPAQDVDDVRQALAEKLLVPAPGTPPRIAQYRGKGILEGWIRVAAIRVALDLSRRAQPPERGVGEAVRVHGDPELAYIKERYRADFEAAVGHALAELSEAERNLLRFRYVDGLTLGTIGAIYGTHTTTALRRLTAAKEALFTRIRAHLVTRLSATPEECKSLIALLHSRLDASLPALLRTPPQS
jgi:RNA polymerase sigma-70 factor (ECF subfamily)